MHESSESNPILLTVNLMSHFHVYGNRWYQLHAFQPQVAKEDMMLAYTCRRKHCHKAYEKYI